MIRILLVDDHKPLRAGLRARIGEARDMMVVAEAENGREAVELASRLRPDVIIMDISMPVLNGIDATRQILAQQSGIKVLALSMHFSRQMVLEALDAGAVGYLLEDCAGDEVITAILTVMKGQTYLSPMITNSEIQPSVALQ